MFFPVPVHGIREMLRVLKPGRKLALAVWHFAENNPFHYTLSRSLTAMSILRHLRRMLWDAFRFATPGKLRAILSEAGVISVSERLLQFPIQAAISLEDFWTLRIEMSENFAKRSLGSQTIR